MKRHVAVLAMSIKPSSMKTLTGVMGWPVSTRVTTDNRVAVGSELSHKARTPDRMALFLRMMLISLLKTKPKRTMRVYHTQIRESANWIRSRVYCPVLISCDIKSLTWYALLWCHHGVVWLNWGPLMPNRCFLCQVRLVLSWRDQTYPIYHRRASEMCVKIWHENGKWY